MTLKIPTFFFLILAICFVACDSPKKEATISNQTASPKSILDIVEQESFSAAFKKLENFQYDSLTGTDIMALESIMTTENIYAFHDKKNRMTKGSILIYKTSRRQIGKMEVLVPGMHMKIKATTYLRDGSKPQQIVDKISINPGQNYEMDFITEKIGDRDFSWDILPQNKWFLAPKNKAKFYVQTKK